MTPSGGDRRDAAVSGPSGSIGNFWVDVTRVTAYVLLPLSLVFSIFLVSQGVIQNFSPYKEVATLDVTTYQQAKNGADGQPLKDAQGAAVTEDVKSQTQTLTMGPVASQEAIKMLGTNGGGFFNANSAHSNVAGSRHPKRWQDVEELLDAGIDVYSTLNVQHLESLNDVVGGITGIVVHETLPDTFFDRTDEVVMVDTPADELIERLHAGKVYLPAQAESDRQRRPRAHSPAPAARGLGAQPLEEHALPARLHGQPAPEARERFGATAAHRHRDRRRLPLARRLTRKAATHRAQQRVTEPAHRRLPTRLARRPSH